jgi:hypothetical protein
MGIEKMQSILGVPVDGKWNAETVQAALKYQKKHNIKESGLPSQELKDVMQSLLDRDMRAKKRKEQNIRHPKFK